MSYVDASLVPGETVMYETRLHWVVMIWQLIIGLLLIAAGGGLFVYVERAADPTAQELHWTEGGSAALAVVGIVIILVGLARRSATEMAVTNRRVIIKTGLASRKTIEMLLNKVESIEVTEPALGRMLGYGSILVIGTGGTSEPFHNMAHPLDFRSQVQQQLEKLQ